MKDMEKTYKGYLANHYATSCDSVGHPTYYTDEHAYLRVTVQKHSQFLAMIKKEIEFK